MEIFGSKSQVYMASYKYSAYDEKGAQIKGEVDATSIANALHLIAQKGLLPSDVSVGQHDGPWWSREFSLSKQSETVKSSELERFFSSFSTLMNAQVPLPRALEFCTQQARSPAMKRILQQVKSSVEDGKSLGDAFQSAGGGVPERYISLITIGESSNRLEEMASRLAKLLADEEHLRGELRAALIYPAILMIMSAMVLGLVVFYLTPTLMPVFTSAGATPPRTLLAMDFVRTVLVNGWPFFIVAAISMLALLRAFKAQLSKIAINSLMLFPLCGRFLKQRETLRFCQTIHLMLSSGSTLPQALAAAQNGSRNPAYRDLLGEAKSQITSGNSLSETLSQSALVDPMVRAVIEVGEKSDRLPEVLETSITTLSTETSQSLSKAVRLLTPLLTLAIGLGVGAIILSTITAIMDLNDIAL